MSFTTLQMFPKNDGAVQDEESQEEVLSETEDQGDGKGSLELPPFWSDQVKLWFAKVEAQFKIQDVNSDKTKYNAVIACLDRDALSAVEYLVSSSPVNDKYLSIKEALVNYFAISEESGFKRLTSVELGERRPSEMLVEVIRLGGNKLHPELVRAIWLERLPTLIQMILVCKGDEDNNHLAQLANQMVEIQRNADKESASIEGRTIQQQEKRKDVIIKPSNYITKRLRNEEENDATDSEELEDLTKDSAKGKKRLCKNYNTISAESSFKMLFGVELGKRRPSEMLAEIIRLGGNKLDPVHVRAIWLERLPAQIQMILLCKSEEDNNQLAKLANKMMEIQRNAEIEDISSEEE